MRVLTLMLLCLSLLLGGPLHAGHDRTVAAAPWQHAGSLPDPCSNAGNRNDQAGAHASSGVHHEVSQRPCSPSHGTGSTHHAGGHVCCLPPVLATLPLLLPAEAAPATLHARVRDLRLSGHIDVPYRPPAV